MSFLTGLMVGFILGVGSMILLMVAGVALWFFVFGRKA